MIDVIIPTYNKPEMLQQCLRALAASTRVDYNLIIADDNSPDPKMVPALKGLKVIKNESGTRGFPNNCNYAVKKTKAEFICLLNSDTVPTPLWLDVMLEEMDDPSVGIVGARLLYPGGHKLAFCLQHAGVAHNRDGMPYHIYRGMDRHFPPANERRELNAVTFAVVLIRRSLWEELGGLSEEYKGGQFEDMDFCLPAGTMVRTANGICPIDDLAVDDKVIDRQGEVTPVLATMRRPYSGTLITATPWFALPITLTASHPVLTLRGWVPAEDLTLSDHVWMPELILPANDSPASISLSDYFDPGTKWRMRGAKIAFRGQHTNTQNDGVPRSVPINNGLLRLFGYYIAEGNVDKYRQYLTFTQHSADKRGLLADVERLMRECFSATPYLHNGKDGISHLVYSSKALAMFFANSCGQGSRNKHMPEIVSQLDAQQRGELLRAMWKGDGSYGTDYRYVTTSEVLAYQIQSTLASFGILCGISKRNNPDAFALKISRAYGIMAAQLFQHDVSCASATQTSHMASRGSGGFWLRLRSVVRNEGILDVFNIETGDNSYVAGSFVVHNCARARKNEWKIVYQPLAKLYHHEHGSGEEFVVETASANAKLFRTTWGSRGSDEHLFKPTGYEGHKEQLAAVVHELRGASMRHALATRTQDHIDRCLRISRLPYKNLPEMEKAIALEMSETILKALAEIGK